jgi:phosphopantothenoylcysteine decarboxylase/phosphopantothenate--cysteine ligase
MKKSKTIIIGITGGIAAYKVPELARGFKKKGYNVKVIMTKNALHFVTPLTMQTVSENPVITDLFALYAAADVKHISLADEASVIAVVPATANIIGKVAGGIADDMLSTVIMAAKVPVLFCPSMNENMYKNKIVQDNIKKLKSFGYQFLEPDTGDLACGCKGKGRLPKIEKIIKKTVSLNRKR